MEVNLIDRAFAHLPLPGGACGKEPTHMNWVRNRVNYEGVTVFTDQMIDASVINHFGGKYKVAWLLEPSHVQSSTYRKIIEVEDMFDEIWTFDKSLLARNPTKYKVHISIGSWSRTDLDQLNRHVKQTPISMIFSNKKQTPGHKERHHVYGAIQAGPFKNKILCAGSGTGTRISDKKREEIMLDSLFTIVIENVTMKHFFTEKLVDPLLLKTIPVYLGCPNVGEYINERGIISFGGSFNINEVLEKIIHSPRELYNKMNPSVEENFSRAKEYEIPEDWIYKHRLLPFLKNRGVN